MNKKIILDKSNRVASITLNRPDIHNAFDDELILAFSSALKTISEDETTDCVLLKANGPNFCAGADLNWMRKMVHYSQAENVNDALLLGELLHSLNTCNKPVIGLIQGNVFGGGIGLVACCDIAIASDNARFCFSEVKIGLIPAIISPYVIPAIGARQARRYFLTAETFSAPIALLLGLIHQVVPAGDLTLTADNVIKHVKQNSPAAVSKAKKLIHHVDKKPISAELRSDMAEIIAALRISDQGQEGLSAFLEKRHPRWITHE